MEMREILFWIVYGPSFSLFVFGSIVSVIWIFSRVAEARASLLLKLLLSAGGVILFVVVDAYALYLAFALSFTEKTDWSVGILNVSAAIVLVMPSFVVLMFLYVTRKRN